MWLGLIYNNINSLMRGLVSLVLLGVIASVAHSQQQQCLRFSSLWPEVQDIVSKMTLEQKIGQMTQGDIPQISNNRQIDAS